MKEPDIQCVVESGYVSLVLKKRRHYTKAQALAISIQKWETVVRLRQLGLTVEDGAGVTCALCRKYNKKTCDGCPVKERTGLDGCSRTPYTRYTRRPSVQQAQAELAFLRSLRKRKARR